MLHRSMNTGSSSGMCSYRMKHFYSVAYTNSEAPSAPHTLVMPQTILLLYMQTAGNPAAYVCPCRYPSALMPVSIYQCKIVLVLCSCCCQQLIAILLTHHVFGHLLVQRWRSKHKPTQPHRKQEGSQLCFYLMIDLAHRHT